MLDLIAHYCTSLPVARLTCSRLEAGPGLMPGVGCPAYHAEGSQLCSILSVCLAYSLSLLIPGSGLS
jgi:hypothetical protein